MMYRILGSGRNIALKINVLEAIVSKNIHWTAITHSTVKTQESLRNTVFHSVLKCEFGSAQHAGHTLSAIKFHVLVSC